MVQGESKDASLLVILAEPQPIFSKKKYTHDRAQIDLSELLEPPIKGNQVCEVMGFTCMLGYFFELIRRDGTIIGGGLLNFEGVFVTIWGNMKISEKKVA